MLTGWQVMRLAGRLGKGRGRTVFPNQGSSALTEVVSADRGDIADRGMQLAVISSASAPLTFGRRLVVQGQEGVYSLHQVGLWLINKGAESRPWWYSLTREMFFSTRGNPHPGVSYRPEFSRSPRGPKSLVQRAYRSLYVPWGLALLVWARVQGALYSETLI